MARCRLLLILAGLLLVWRTSVLMTAGPLKSEPPPLDGSGLVDVPGVVHVHSVHSHDGRAEISEIVEAARRTRLEFVILTEHNNFGIGAEGRDGWHNGILLLGGQEAGARDETDPSTGATRGSHVLIIGPRSLDGDVSLMTSREIIKESARAGGLTFASHPRSRRIPWMGPTSGLTGTEMCSFFTEFKRLSVPEIAAIVLAYPFNPLQAMGRVMSSQPLDLEFFDEVAATRRFVGIGGADAHANVRVRKRWNVPFPGMESFFGTMKTHLMLSSALGTDPGHAREMLLDALREGRAYISFDYLADPTGFSFVSHVLDAIHPMGSISPLDGTTLRVAAPSVEGVEIRLMRNGEEVARSHSSLLEHRPREPGAYRAEVHLNIRSPFLGLRTRRLWILSNPIFVGEGWLDGDRAEG